MQDHAIEQEIQAKGLTAPRITPADVEANIASEHYFTADDGALSARLRDLVEAGADASGFYGELLEPPAELKLLTFCVLVLRNGFTVTGESACASPENFDAELGRKIARQNAIAKVWPLMGYELRSQLARAQGVGQCADEACEHASNLLAAAAAPAQPLLDVVVHEQGEVRA